MNAAETPLTGIENLGKPALVVGVVSLVLCVLLGLRNSTQFFHSYLLAFVFFVGLSVGSCEVLMIHYLIGGTWGFPLRRPLEAGVRTFYLMAVLLLPILFRLPTIYSWADPAKVHADPVLQYKHFYLNVPFFVVRNVIYFTAWLLLAYFILKWSRLQDETGEPELTHRLQALSAPGLLIFGLTITFACVDWVMSLEPTFFSTIYGMIFMVTEALAGMSLATVAIVLLARRNKFSGLVTPKVLGDYGNLLLTFTMLWAYLSFSQYLIIWAGNLRDEIPWYVVRVEGSWNYVAQVLIVFHFAVPFVLLLMRFVKRRAASLGWLAVGLVVVSFVDIYWLTVPAFEPARPQFHLTDLFAIVGIGGLWLWQFASQLKGRSELPLQDPRLKEILQQV